MRPTQFKVAQGFEPRQCDSRAKMGSHGATLPPYDKGQDKGQALDEPTPLRETDEHRNRYSSTWLTTNIKGAINCK